MTNYQFSADQISQHVVKFSADLHPAVNMEETRPAMQSFANGLIDQFPEYFETLVSGPRQFRVNKTFKINTGQAEIITLAWGQRGPVLTLPKRLFISGPQDVNGPDPDIVINRAIQELGERFPDRGIPRVSLIHNIVFDTDQANSLEIVAANFTKESWRSQINSTRIQLQGERDGKMLAYDIRPTYVSPGGRAAWPAPDDARFGVVVAVDIAVADAENMVSPEAVGDLLSFNQYYVPGELVNFLNGVS
ncbi:hypothetical protein ACFL6U_24465 [Planctomycetota bacterium]